MSSDYEKCFEFAPCAPRGETFSYRARPCRYESSSGRSETDATSSDPNAKKTDPTSCKELCPYRDYCEQSAGRLKILERVYGEWIKVTLAEPSASIVVRSEHQFNKADRLRLSLRKHIYELQASGSKFQDDYWVEFRLTQRGLDAMRNTGQFSPEVLAGLQKLVKEKTCLDKIEFRQYLNEILSRLPADNDPKPPLLPRDGQKTAILDWVSSAGGCRSIRAEDRFGTYLGFVDLRLNNPQWPLAMGLLAPPKRLRDDPEVFLITGEYGPMFGGTGFPCTIYSMHDPKTGGARCAQASIIMALGLLADRGARLIGSYSLTYLAIKRTPKPVVPSASMASDASGETETKSEDRDCIGKAHSQLPSFEAGGLSLGQMANVLKDKDKDEDKTEGEDRVRLGVRPHHFMFSLPPAAKTVNADSERLSYVQCGIMFKIIRSYIQSRFPVILLVNSGKWWWWRKHKSPADNDHTVTIVGAKGKAGRWEKNAFIVHDPGHEPYVVRSVTHCLNAALRSRAENNSISFICVCDKNAKISLNACINLIKQEEGPNFWELHTSTGGLNDRRDFEFHLLDRDDIASILVSNIDSWSDERVESAVAGYKNFLRKRLPRMRYWCVTAVNEKDERKTWAFPAEERWGGQDSGWFIRAVFKHGSRGLGLYGHCRESDALVKCPEFFEPPKEPPHDGKPASPGMQRPDQQQRPQS